MSEILKYLKEAKLTEALDSFKNASEQEQREIFSQISALIEEQEPILKIAPKMMPILRRDLKPGKTYEDFLTAWTPPGTTFSIDKQNTVDYFDVPVQVVNAQNIQKPNEIVSIGLVDADQKKLVESGEKFKETEAIRRQKVAEITEGGSLNIYKVLGIYRLGK